MGLFFLFDSPHDKRNIRGDGQQVSNHFEIRLHQHIVDSVVGDGCGQQSKGADHKKLVFLFYKGYSHTHKERTHSVHQTCAEGAGNGIEHIERIAVSQVERIFQNGKSDTHRH